jgi:hypothetical protein
MQQYMGEIPGLICQQKILNTHRPTLVGADAGAGVPNQ